MKITLLIIIGAVLVFLCGLATIFTVYNMSKISINSQPSVEELVETQIPPTLDSPTEVPKIAVFPTSISLRAFPPTWTPAPTLTPIPTLQKPSGMATQTFLPPIPGSENYIPQEIQQYEQPQPQQYGCPSSYDTQMHEYYLQSINASYKNELNMLDYYIQMALMNGDAMEVYRWNQQKKYSQSIYDSDVANENTRYVNLCK